MKVLVGCEQFGHMREAFRRRGHDAWSCDLEPARDNSPYHLQCDVLTVLDDGWDLGIFHPDCTFLTCSAEWAYKDPDFERYPGIGYHQKVKPGTLVGAARRQAREDAIGFVFKLRDSKIPKKAIENPVGILSRRWRKPNQTVQPNWFGDDASKATCWWLEGGLPPLVPTQMIAPRMVGGRPRWGNQTDGGQNKLPPSDDRAMLRAETLPGSADACAEQWGSCAQTANLLPRAAARVVCDCGPICQDRRDGCRYTLSSQTRETHPMNYDNWKTHNPDDDRCEFCGVHPRECRGGWQPDQCTGECGKGWRDPDYEYEKMRDEG